jgi:hypothetical protein
LLHFQNQLAGRLSTLILRIVLAVFMHLLVYIVINPGSNHPQP